jgi:hypothetical protein
MALRQQIILLVRLIDDGSTADRKRPIFGHLNTKRTLLTDYFVESRVWCFSEAYAVVSNLDVSITAKQSLFTNNLAQHIKSFFMSKMGRLQKKARQCGLAFDYLPELMSVL